MSYGGLAYDLSRVNAYPTSSTHLNISGQYYVNRVHFCSLAVKPGCFIWVKTDLWALTSLVSLIDRLKIRVNFLYLEVIFAATSHPIPRYWTAHSSRRAFASLT